MQDKNRFYLQIWGPGTPEFPVFPRMRRRTPGVDALREEVLAFWWSGRIRPEEKKNGTDRSPMAEKVYEDCVQDEMS